LGFQDVMINSYHIIHTSIQHQLDNNIHVPLSHNKKIKNMIKTIFKKICNEDHTTKQLEKNKIKKKGIKTKKNINIEFF